MRADLERELAAEAAQRKQVEGWLARAVPRRVPALFLEPHDWMGCSIRAHQSRLCRSWMARQPRSACWGC